jgi:hypothetical protein
MRKSLVIGLGETGKPLLEVLSETYLDSDGWDLDMKADAPIDTYEFLNICIPYSDKFVDIVRSYQEAFMPELTIIHSTVPIGTTSDIGRAVHSPIMGDHTDMKQSLKAFTKWIGGELAWIAGDFLRTAGFKTHILESSEETETLKLLSLAKYGVNIAINKYGKEIFDKYGWNYQDAILWDCFYNDGLQIVGRGRYKRPIIYPINGKIGGNCVIQNTEKLNEQFPHELLKGILKYA